MNSDNPVNHKNITTSNQDESSKTDSKSDIKQEIIEEELLGANTETDTINPELYNPEIKTKKNDNKNSKIQTEDFIYSLPDGYIINEKKVPDYLKIKDKKRINFSKIIKGIFLFQLLFFNILFLSISIIFLYYFNYIKNPPPLLLTLVSSYFRLFICYFFCSVFTIIIFIMISTKKFKRK